MFRRPIDISEDSAKIFTDLPHYDQPVEDLVEIVKSTVEKQSNPFDKKGLDFGRNHSPKGKVIIDAGCGSGLKALPIALAGAELVIGVDASSEAIKRASEVAKRLSVNNAIFENAYLEDLPSVLKKHELNSVDVIVNYQNLHHTENWQKNLQIFRSCLKEGGLLICNIADPTAGRGNFMIKNKIAYNLGRTVDQKINIGKTLFGWIDKKKNVGNIEWKAFYADLYAAFYHWITPRKMIRALNAADLELIDSFPAYTLEHWFKGNPQSERAKRIQNLTGAAPWTAPLFYFIMRFRQWAFGGDTRTYYTRAK